jgi:hypothetical protein
VEGGRGHQGNVADETVPAPVHRLDEVWGLGVIPQRLAQLTNADGQHDLTDRRLRPQGLEQGVFGEELIRVFDQIPQEGEGFGPQDTDLGAAPQAFVGQIELHRHSGARGLWQHGHLPADGP